MYRVISCFAAILIAAQAAFSQTEIDKSNTGPIASIAVVDRSGTDSPKSIVVSTLSKYYHPQDGVSINELIERALRLNLELTAARLEIDRAKARLTQARLRPNPTLEFEQQSGQLVGDGGDGQISIGAALPIEIYGQRNARVNVAQIQIEAAKLKCETANGHWRQIFLQITPKLLLLCVSWARPNACSIWTFKLPGLCRFVLTKAKLRR